MRGLLAALAGRERAVLVLTFYAERDSREIGLGSGPRRTTSGPFATGPWPGCARRGEAVGALRDGIRGAARRGWHGVLLPSIVERLARDGVRLHTYRLRPGIPVPCSVEPEDDLMIGRLEADLTGVERLDLELTAGADVVGAQRFEDVPIDRRAGEVILCMPAAIARPLPAHQMRVRLVVLQGGADRELGQYVFDHSPRRPRP